jgi:hypothetical protein
MFSDSAGLRGVGWNFSIASPFISTYFRFRGYDVILLGPHGNYVVRV